MELVMVLLEPPQHIGGCVDIVQVDILEADRKAVHYLQAFAREVAS